MSRCLKSLMSSDSEVVAIKSRDGHYRKFKSAGNNQFTLNMTVLKIVSCSLILAIQRYMKINADFLFPWQMRTHTYVHQQHFRPETHRYTTNTKL